MEIRRKSIEFSHKTRIEHIITLCHIINEYENFYQRLKGVGDIEPKFLQKLEKLSNGEKGLMSKKTKNFYNSNKEIIDTINKFSSIRSFICDNYRKEYPQKGPYIEREEFSLIKNYVLENMNQIDKILAVLKRLKELGFTELYFDSKLDFTKGEYYLPSKEPGYVDIDFVNNISVIPHYKSNAISYKTDNSPYLIGLLITFFPSEKYANIISQEILLNSLIFELSELPNELSKESTVNQIIELSKQKEPVNSVITNSVDFSVGIKNLKNAYQQLESIVTRVKEGDITVASSGDDIKAIYLQIGECISKLQKMSDEYDAAAILKCPDLSQDVLDSVKKRCLTQKENARFHVH